MTCPSCGEVLTEERGKATLLRIKSRILAYRKETGEIQTNCPKCKTSVDVTNFLRKLLESS